MTREKLTENFYKDEFACRCGCGLNLISPELVKLLQEIRDVFKAPLVITSGTRCVNQNARKGGSSRSDHLKGLAVDIGCRDSQVRRVLLKIALAVGIPTIGVKKDCLHFSIGLPARVFTYD